MTAMPSRNGEPATERWTEASCKRLRNCEPPRLPLDGAGNAAEAQGRAGTEADLDRSQTAALRR